jgi:broad specificity phosphatase PhoE
MPRLILVRHGEAAAGFTQDLDPGLSDRGRQQAEAVAAALTLEGPLPIVTSPLRRTTETAVPLEVAWTRQATVEPRVSEIPWPTDDLDERGRFLQRAIRGTWADLPDEYREWRARLLAALEEIAHDSVIFTHLIAINVAIGAATGDDRVLIFHVDNCSRTIVETGGPAMQVTDIGVEADTRIW